MALFFKTWDNGTQDVTVNTNDTYVYHFLDGKDYLTVTKNANGPSLYNMGAGDDRVWLYGTGSAVYGGTGDDEIKAINNHGRDTIDGGSGNDTIYSTTYSGNELADIIQGGAGNDLISMYHGIGAVVHGGSGNDTIHSGNGEGGAYYGDDGNDEMHIHNVYFKAPESHYGGPGDDSYYLLDWAGSTQNSSVIEAANEGNDTVYVRADRAFYLPDNVENLYAVNDDSYAISRLLPLVGNAGSNHITGSQWGSHIRGGAGLDHLVGMDREDAIFGGDGRDVILGNGGNDTIYGWSDDGTLSQNGEPDNDDIFGGNGNDVIYAGFDNDYIDGGRGNDTILGQSGNDTLHGADGADWMDGGTGDDLYYVDNTGDKVFEAAGEGKDEVRSYIASYTLTANVETLRLMATGTTSGTGNEIDNRLYGSNDSNVLHGMNGNDVLSGLLGNDTLYGDNGNDSLYGDSGADYMRGGYGDDYLAAGSGNDNVYGDVGQDKLFGAAGNDWLYGGSGNDSIYGGTGDDRIRGEMGGDQLTGNAGADSFIFTSVSDSFGNGNFMDTITDFEQGLDLINLMAIDADTTTAGNQAFKFVGEGAPMYGDAGDLWTETSADGKTTHIYGDVDGNGWADIHIAVNATDFVVSDFVL